MGCTEYESYYLKESEWKLLLAGIGIRAWYGFGSERNETGKTEADLHRMLADLYQKHVIDWESGSVVIRQPFSAIFASLQKSRSCITIRKQKGGEPLRCCYIGETDVIVTEKSQREEEVICVFSLSKETFLMFVLEDLEISEGIFEESERENSADGSADGENIMSFRLQNSRNGQLNYELILQESGLQTFLVVRKEDTVRRMPYRLSELKECLRKWLNGGETDEGM